MPSNMDAISETPTLVLKMLVSKFEIVEGPMRWPCPNYTAVMRDIHGQGIHTNVAA